MVHIGTGLDLTAHLLVGILIVRLHIVLHIIELRQLQTDSPPAHLALAAERYGKVEAGIILTTREDAEDANRIVSVMSGDVKTAPIVAIDKAASRHLGFQLGRCVVIAGLAQHAHLVKFLKTVLIVIDVGLAQDSRLQAEGQVLACTISEVGIEAHQVSHEHAS